MAKAKGDLQLPEKVTLSWLFTHLTVGMWGSLVGFIVGAFLLGTSLGQTSLVKELYGNKEPSPTPKISSEELKVRVDQLIQGHNENIKSLYNAISDQEKSAGNGSYGTYDHMRAAERLRETLKQENASFEKKLTALKEIDKPQPTSSNTQTTPGS